MNSKPESNQCVNFASVLIFIFSLFVTFESMEGKTTIRADYQLYVNPLVEFPDNKAAEKGILNLVDKNPATLIRYNVLQSGAALTLYLKNNENFNAIQLKYGPSTKIEDQIARCVVEVVKVSIRQTGKVETLQEFILDLNPDIDDKIQTITFPYTVTGDCIRLEVLSTVGDPGRQYVVWSEMDILSSGQSVLTYDENSLMQEYKLSSRQYQLYNLLSLYNGVRKVIFSNLNKQLAIWHSLGVQTEQIRFDNEHQQTGIYIEIQQSVSNRFQGVIFCGIGGGKIYSTDPQRLPYQLADKMAIGEWYFDDSANFWVRIGKGQWKKGSNYFYNTDFGDLLTLEMPYIKF